MTDQSKALAALSQALKLEKEGHEFYLQAAEETLDEKGKAMFTSLADDEKIHLEMVQRQLQALKGGGSYVLLPDLSVPSIDLGAKLFPPQREKVAAKVGVNPGELDALHVALEREMKSYDLYRQAAQETDDENGKAMYTWLASAETTHFNLLMSNYESLVSMGGWA